MTLAARIVVLVALATGPARAAEGVDFFEAKVRPVLIDHCYSCHSAKAGKAKGGLTLDTAAGVRKGGDSGPLWEPNGESLLLTALAHDPAGVQMPPKGKLPAAAIADVQKWVALGGPLPADAAPASAAASAIDPKAYWAFQPLARRPAPVVSAPAWVRGPIDPFVLRKLDENRMRTAPEADRRTLIRRVHFDLTGLPPTFEEVEAFAADPAADAYEKLADRLLASPHFGAKWGRHWLDVARYAEDNSTSESTNQPPRFPHHYRDWVIRAVNEDLPYDEFVRRQLAADRLDLPPAESAALGFLALGPFYAKEPKLAKDVIATVVADEWDERIDTITRGVLGLTVACARCHDHKFDPVSQQDYYALAGVVASTQPVESPLDPVPPAEAEVLNRARADTIKAKLYLQAARLERTAAKLEGKDAAPFEKKVAEAQKREAKLKEEEKALYRGPLANAVRDGALWLDASDPAWTWVEYRPGEAQDLPVYVRGDPSRPGAVAPRRFLTALSPAGAKPFTDGSGRRELADCLVGEAAPLTARVYVNRVWGWLFGTGLVATPSNFGKLGDPPSHPELLDDLAARFVADGWSLKRLVRELVLSSTYRQSSRHDAGFQQRDPEDRLLWRASRKRLEAEQWRDAVLAVSGLLRPDAGGPSESLDDPKSLRRTVYGKVSRSRASDLHRLFDFPPPITHGEKRNQTTTPLQQLYLLNGPLVRQAAESLAKRVAGGEPAGCGDEDVARELFRRVLLREPTGGELAAALELARTGRDGPAWDRVAQGLLVSNEFLFSN